MRKNLAGVKVLLNQPITVPPWRGNKLTEKNKTSLQEYEKLFKVCTDLQSMQRMEIICLIFNVCHALQRSCTQSGCATQLIIICTLAVLVFVKKFQWDQRIDHSKTV